MMQPLLNVPAALRELPQWVGFRVANGKKTPVIADAPARKAKSNDPATWRSFDVALKALQADAFNAIAYALHGDFIGVDLDDCIVNGALSAEAGEIVTKLASYTERSFSGNGVHTLLNGPLPDGKGYKRGGVEVYGRARFLICTGDHLPGTPTTIRHNPEAVNWLLGRATPKAGTASKQDIASDFSDGSDSLRHTTGLLSETPATRAGSDATFMDVETVISATLPRRAGERNRRLFDLARGLKFNARMQRSQKTELREIAKLWHALALPVMGTKDFDTTWADFRYAWRRAHSPLGITLETVWQRAISAPLPAVAADYDSDHMRKLVALCAALDRNNGGGVFILSSYDAARLLRIHQRQAHRFLESLADDEVISLVCRGNTARASRYRWTGGTA